MRSMRGDAALLYILYFLFLTARCNKFNRSAKNLFQAK